MLSALPLRAGVGSQVAPTTFEELTPGGGNFDAIRRAAAQAATDEAAQQWVRGAVEVALLLLEQVFLELVYVRGDFLSAAQFLRATVQPMVTLWAGLHKEAWSHSGKGQAPAADMLRELSSVLTNPEGMARAVWPSGGVAEARERLVGKVYGYISPDDLVPSGRLVTLLKQAVRYQRLGDVHDDDQDDDEDDGETVSLLQDNKPTYTPLQFKEQKTLTQNADEIWYLQFSPDGKYLASASADSLTDRKILIYDVENDFQVYRVLAGNTQCVLYLSFSPDSRYIVSCPFNETANIYDIHTDGLPTDINETVQHCEADRIKAQIIQPCLSFQILIPSKAAPNSRHTSHSGATLPGDDASSSSPGDTPTSSSSSQGHHQTGRHTATTATATATTTTTTPPQSSSTWPRIWCCDWFHTQGHSGKFIVGSPDREVAIYDINERAIIYKFSEHAGMETDRDKLSSRPRLFHNIFEAEADGTRTDHSTGKSLFPRIHDVKISYDDKYLILMTHQGTIDVYDISDLPPNGNMPHFALKSFAPKRINQLKIQKNMTCVSLPQPDPATGVVDPALQNLLLVNLRFSEIQLWNYKENLLVQKYFGQRQEQFIIRSCFGCENKLVLSGSEDGKIYIWDRAQGCVLGVLPGHTGERATAAGSNKKFGKNCNVVAWSPTDKHIFASGGDDGYVKIWRVIKGRK
ncbi:glucose-induced degradation complex subunit GID7 KNAG_0C00410 [Huiozyma naganishii CBS 8797]|uniref:Anaphase-promoting complex subunit 4 WD40 domain-containing protein n=1 Tax=Huiozyma naganishii (strain ATCC MYA-139 / BCRC 22969 / CBS 8797 / KCTC 17520 / NBRC 10181 / NCYC 3082 / Yp74L-3) TaxID=1071383 RepID=J7R2V6_HUIN7|nr:hypothetical protein KNAG_0C00410 [Kazachstania naganishii CBS 8797]CCK69155.1 hypothetical protein KNAG_0C00410 [Kazachstania naganishii CBS 8797]